MNPQADVHQAIDVLIGHINAALLAKPCPAATARYRTALSKCGEARLDLSDPRFGPHTRLRDALARLKTAKMLAAEARAIQDEHEMRETWRTATT